MKKCWFAGLAFLGFLTACSADEVPAAPQPASRVRPVISVMDEGTGVLTRADGDLSSTYFRAGEDVGFLLLDRSTHGLYTDTQGLIRYSYDGVYWSTEEGYAMSDNYVDVYCFYPYPSDRDNTYDGLYPESYLPIETASNTDYLWGTMHSSFVGKVNGPNPDVSMVMYHALSRISFRVKRQIEFNPNNTVTKGAVSQFTVKTQKNGSVNPMRGSCKYSFITGTINETGAVYDASPVEFTTIAGHQLGQAVGSTIGEDSEFMTVLPGTGILTIDLTVDGQPYTVTLDPHSFVAGTHYRVNLVYTGSQVEFPSASGAAGTAMEIVAWNSGGTLEVKRN